MQQSSPVAPGPWVLGVGRQRNGAARIDPCCPPHPAPGLACGRGVEALLLARLAGPHALDKVGARREERGILPWLQAGLRRAARNDDRLGQRLDARWAAPFHRVFGAIALNALEVYALSSPGLQQDTTTLRRSGAYEEAIRPVAGLVPPRPAAGHSQEGRDALKPGLLRLGVSREGLPLRLGGRAGKPRDRPEPPRAIAEWGALGRDGGRGLVAASKADGPRPLGGCGEQRVGLIPLVPRPWAVRQEVEAWGPQPGALPRVLAKPGRSRQEPPRRWSGPSVVRRVAVAEADGRRERAELRWLGGHASPLAPQAAVTDAAAQAQAAAPGAEPLARVAARWFAWAADAAAALAVYAGRGPGVPRPAMPRGKRSRHGSNARSEAVPPRPSSPRTASGSASGARPKPTCQPPPRRAGPSWRPPWGQSAVQRPRDARPIGLRWRKHPAAISPVWRENPERVAA
jgi:hypothetical protein